MRKSSIVVWAVAAMFAGPVAASDLPKEGKPSGPITAPARTKWPI
jgi:hypothetical protein